MAVVPAAFLWLIGAAVVGMAAVDVMIIQHTRNLCAHCAVPALERGDMDRARPWLRRYHVWEARPVVSLLHFFSVPVAVWAACWAVGSAPGWEWLEGTRSTGILLATMGVMHAWKAHTQDVHARLIMWCPWCRGDGGAREGAPDPEAPKRLPV